MCPVQTTRILRQTNSTNSITPAIPRYAPASCSAILGGDRARSETGSATILARKAMAKESGEGPPSPGGGALNVSSSGGSITGRTSLAGTAAAGAAGLRGAPQVQHGQGATTGMGLHGRGLAATLADARLSAGAGKGAVLGQATYSAATGCFGHVGGLGRFCCIGRGRTWYVRTSARSAVPCAVYASCSISHGLRPGGVCKQVARFIKGLPPGGVAPGAGAARGPQRCGGGGQLRQAGDLGKLCT